MFLEKYLNTPRGNKNVETNLDNVVVNLNGLDPSPKGKFQKKYVKKGE